jgi:hypothetical protein
MRARRPRRRGYRAAAAATWPADADAPPGAVLAWPVPAAIPAISVITPTAMAILVVHRIRMRVPFAYALVLVWIRRAFPSAGTIPAGILARKGTKATQARAT